MYEAFDTDPPLKSMGVVCPVPVIFRITGPESMITWEPPARLMLLKL